MTIKEVENLTGLSRSNVRFYEKEKLIAPSRNESNGYREYSDGDIENLKKIAYLRTLGISVDDIRNIISEKIALREAIRKQNDALKRQITDMKRAKALCEKMLTEENINYEELQVEQYVTGLEEYWNDSEPVFRLDSVSFIYAWGGFITWTIITVLCLLTGVLSYTKLSPEIPVQWSGGVATSMVDKKFIFAYPVACIVIRYLISSFIYVKLQMNNRYGEIMTEYLTNCICFVVLSVEVFSILFIYGVLKSIGVVLLADTVVLLGILMTSLRKKGAPAI